MPQAPLGALVRYVRGLTAPRSAGDPSDAELLDRFIAARDPAAFELILRRHGPMVLGVCRRVLDDPHEADDAFQATFLVLVRKAAGIGKRGSVGSWLYGVAFRIARKARAQAARRRRHERQAVPAMTTEPSDDFLWRELRPVLDEELSRLPEKLRAPLVLCVLQGKTHEAAARELGWSKGSVSGRIAKARELLRGRLARRGVTLSAGALAVLTAEAGAAVPAGLIAATNRAAITLLVGPAAGGISAPVATMMRGALQAMFLAQLKAVAAVFLVLGTLAVGGVFLAPLVGARDDAQQPRPAPQPRPVASTAAWQLAATVPGVDDYTIALSLTPDGKRLAVVGGKVFGADDRKTDGNRPRGQAVVWDLSGATPHEAYRFSSDARQIGAVAFSPDGKLLALDASDDTLKLFDAASGRERATIPTKVSLPAGAFAPDGKTLAVRSRWDLKFLDLTAAGFPEKSVVKPPADNFSPRALSADRKRAAYLAFGGDGMIRLVVRELATGREIARCEAPSFVDGLQFSPDGKRLAAQGMHRGGDGSGIYLWDAATGRLVAQLRDASDGGISAPGAFSPDGELLAMGTMGGTVYLWDVAAGKNRGMIPAHSAGVSAVAFAPDGKSLATAGRDGKVRLWKRTGTAYPASTPAGGPKPADVYVVRATVQVKHTDIVQAPTDSLSDLAFAPDGKSFAAANQNRLVRLWKFRDGRATDWATLGGHTHYVYAVAYSPDGKTLATAGGVHDQPGELRLWDLTGDAPKERASLHGHRTTVERLAFAPDGTRLAAGDGSGAVIVWDVATGRAAASFQPHFRPVHGLAFSPDGKLIATASQDKSAKIIDADTGRVRHTLSGFKSFALSAAFSPDGKRLVTGDQDSLGRVWDVATGEQVASLGGQANYIESVAFSPDGRRILTASMSGLIKVWDAATYQSVTGLMGPGRHRVKRAAFSPDGRFLAAGMLDGTVVVWEVVRPGGS